MRKLFSKEKITQLSDTFSTSIKILKLLWKVDKGLFLANFFAVSVPSIVPFITAYIFKLVIDLVVAAVNGTPFDYNQLILLLIALFIAQYFQRLSFTVQGFVTQMLVTKFPLTMNEMVLGKISSLDLQYFEDSNFRDTLQKVRESYDFRPLNLIYNIFFLWQSVLQVIIALIAIVTLNPWLALFGLFVALPDLYTQLTFSKVGWSIWNRTTPQRKKYEYLSNLLQTGTNIKEVKIFQTAKRFISDLLEVYGKFYKENKDANIKQLKVNSALNFFDVGITMGIAVYVILEAIAKRITIGDISFYQSVISNFNNGIGGAFRNLANIFDQTLYVKSIFELLAIESNIKEIEKPKKIDFNHTPLIEFKNVSFRYPGTKRWVFKNFNLKINPGEKVALVGENGAGKTTLIKLLARFYDVNEGEIMIDGTNIKELELESWYKAIGVLFQDFIKYEYPAKDNIFFGRIWEKENLESIIDAAKSAGAHDVISKFDNEYQQMLGKTFEGGIELSGGQWQKIALARAFFRNAPILVLDEPTSAIDAKAESEIFHRVERLSKYKTVIIISHRFSTVRNADKIYVIDNGKIKESGTHQELMKLDGQYATLFNLQAKGYQ
jgi:ATP-binding cassette, subfamily B, bacterial